MKTIRMFTMLCAGALVWAAAAGVATAQEGPRFTMTELMERMPARDTLEARWVFGALIDAGPAALEDICVKAGGGTTPAAVQATHAVSGLAAFVTGAGREASRLVFTGAVARALPRAVSPEHAAFLIAALQTTGRAESLRPLARYLGDERLCEPAVQAMQTIGGEAGELFLAALPSAAGKPRLTLIKALGETRTDDAVTMLLEETRSGHASRAAAALQALAVIGDPDAADTLRAALGMPAGTRDAAVQRLLTFAGRRAQEGDRSMAARIASDVHAAAATPVESHLRIAALDMLVRLNGAESLGLVMASLSDTSAATQDALLRLANSVPGSAVTDMMVQRLAVAPAPERARIVRILGVRGDTAAFGAVSAAVEDAASPVRGVAMHAAVTLDAQKAVPVLLARLQKNDDAADVQAVREALARVPAAVAAAPMAAALPSAGPRATVALLDLLAACGSGVPVEPVKALTADGRAPVRGAAIRTLGAILPPSEMPVLIERVVKGTTETERTLAAQALAAVAERIPEREARAVPVIDRLAASPASERPALLRALGRIGGAQALRVVTENGRSKDPVVREAAQRSLTDWPSMEAFDSLLVLARSKEKLPIRVLALRACVRLVEAAPFNPATAVRYHERTLAAAERVEEKRLVIGAVANLRIPDALRLLAPYISDDSLGLEAAMASWKIAQRPDDRTSAEAARRLIEPRIPAHFRAQAARVFDAREWLNHPPEGFRALFNGRDLHGWKGLVGDPVSRAAMTAGQLAAAQERADSSMRAHWSVADGLLVFDGKGESICTAEDHGDFEMLVDWKIEKNGDSGIYLRGSPQVQIWDPAQWPEGSGGLYNNQKGPSKPLVRADNPVGEWNTFRIRMIGDRVTVYLNDVLVVDSVALENYWDRSIPIYAAGQIELQAHNTPLYFRNVFIRDIPRRRTDLFSGSIMNGTDLTGWQVVGGRSGSWEAKDGVLFTQGEGGGWISTEKEYANFVLDLDFRVVPGGNSGVFIRAPHTGDPAYTGMEIQVLDDAAPVYATLKPWQYTGSIYAVQAPSVRATKPAGEWQHMQITANGPHVTVVLNGQTIVDADLLQHMDKEPEHPGLKRRKGYIGMQSHGTRVEYRNIMLRELE